MDGESWLCSFCSRTTATLFCLCSPAGTFLCTPCFSPHVTKALSHTHTVNPVQCYRYKDVPGYLDRLQQRRKTVETAKVELGKSVASIDACIEEICGSMRVVIAAVRKCANREIGKLQELKEKMKTDIEQSLAEVEKTLYEDSPALNSKYGPAFWACGRHYAWMSLFKYVVETKVDSLRSIFRIDYSTDCVRTDMYPTIFPQIYGDSLKRHNLLTGEVTEAKLPIALSHTATFCMVGPDTVLCVGTESPAGKSAYLLTISTAALTQLPPMLTARSLPGMVTHSFSVYLFGGRNSSKKAILDCESFAIPRKSWDPLPNMTYNKPIITPCLFKTDIYLPDFRSLGKSEIFSLSSHQFKINYVFSAHLKGNLVAFVHNEEVIILTETGKVGRWRRWQESTIREDTLEMKDKKVRSSITPVRVGSEYVWTRIAGGEVVRFDVDLMKVAE